MNWHPDEDILETPDTDSCYSDQIPRPYHNSKDSRHSLFCSNSRTSTPVRAINEKEILAPFEGSSERYGRRNLSDTRTYFDRSQSVDTHRRHSKLEEVQTSNNVSNGLDHQRNLDSHGNSSQADEGQDSEHAEFDTDDAIAR
jgi:hypothetical protein